MTEDQTEKPTSAADFVLAEVRANPAISYGELQAKAELKGFKVFPILFGRAKRMVALEGGRAPAPQSEAPPVADPVAPEPGRTGHPGPYSVPSKRGRGRPMSPEMAFAIEFLRSAPRAKAKDVQAAAKNAGIELTAVVVSRARTRLGTARVRRRVGYDWAEAPAKVAAPQATERHQSDEGRPRPRVRDRASTALPFDIHALVDSIRSLEAERDGLRDALAEISVVLERIRKRD